MPDKKTSAAMQLVLDQLHTEFDRLNTVHFDSRLKKPETVFSLRKSYGGYFQQRTYRIVLSWQAYREHGWDETLNTFRHEVAHIVYLHHRKEFWDLATAIGVTRKYAREPLKRHARRTLVYECPGCRKQIKRLRRINNSSCASCDRRYNPAFRFRLVEEIPAAS